MDAPQACISKYPNIHNIQRKEPHIVTHIHKPYYCETHSLAAQSREGVNLFLPTGVFSASCHLKRLMSSPCLLIQLETGIGYEFRFFSCGAIAFWGHFNLLRQVISKPCSSTPSMRLFQLLLIRCNAYQCTFCCMLRDIACGISISCAALPTYRCIDGFISPKSPPNLFGTSFPIIWQPFSSFALSFVCATHVLYLRMHSRCHREGAAANFLEYCVLDASSNFPAACLTLRAN